MSRAASQPAVVTYDRKPYSVELREVPVPEIGDEDVLLEVSAVGVCGSDLHMWTGDHGWRVNYPCILGHEFAGHVREVGRRVAHFSIGERVVSETAAVIDPTNPMSRRGLYNLDPTRLGYGAAVDGAMTRFVRVPTRILHRVPDELPFPESLCHRCAAPPRYVRTPSSTFILCPLLPEKYPRQPVRSCPLFRPRNDLDPERK